MVSHKNHEKLRKKVSEANVRRNPEWYAGMAFLPIVPGSFDPSDAQIAAKAEKSLKSANDGQKPPKTAKKSEIGEIPAESRLVERVRPIGWSFAAWKRYLKEKGVLW